MEVDFSGLRVVQEQVYIRMFCVKSASFLFFVLVGCWTVGCRMLGCGDLERVAACAGPCGNQTSLHWVSSSFLLLLFVCRSVSI